MTFNIKSKELEAFASLVLAGLATDRDFELWPNKSDIRAIKTDNSAKHYRSCVTPVAERKVLDPKFPRRYRMRSSEETRDRSGDVISVAGWELDNNRNNPVIFADHSAIMEKLVANTRTWELATKEKPPALYETFDFVDAGISPIADVCEGLWRTGFGHACSVGFIPLETVYPDDEDERTKLGIGRFGCFFKRQEKLETSLVGIGCHANALGAAKSFTTRSVIDHRLDVAEAVWELVKRNVVSREAGRAFLKATDKRSVRTLFPVTIIEARKAASVATEPKTETSAASSVETTTQKEAVQEHHTKTAEPNAEHAAALAELRTRADAQDARIASLETQVVELKAQRTNTTTKETPRDFYAALDAFDVGQITRSIERGLDQATS